jgi:hypothetical protein
MNAAGANRKIVQLQDPSTARGKEINNVTLRGAESVSEHGSMDNSELSHWALG